VKVLVVALLVAARVRAAGPGDERLIDDSVEFLATGA